MESLRCKWLCNFSRSRNRGEFNGSRYLAVMPAAQHVANRNMDDANSLETAIRELNQPDSLPVLTIARPKWLMNEAYREDCAYCVAGIVVDLPKLLGSGRQFIP